MAQNDYVLDMEKFIEATSRAGVSMREFAYSMETLRRAGMFTRDSEQEVCTCWLGADASFGDANERMVCVVHGNESLRRKKPKLLKGRAMVLSGDVPHG